VDFLLLYHPETSTEKKIILEYDGFKDHFGEGIGIDSSNYSTTTRKRMCIASPLAVLARWDSP
jgi:hypothetical protein